MQASRISHPNVVHSFSLSMRKNAPLYSSDSQIAGDRGELVHDAQKKREGEIWRRNGGGGREGGREVQSREGREK